MKDVLTHMEDEYIEAFSMARKFPGLTLDAGSH